MLGQAPLLEGRDRARLTMSLLLFACHLHPGHRGARKSHTRLGVQRLNKMECHTERIAQRKHVTEHRYEGSISSRVHGINRDTGGHKSLCDTPDTNGVPDI